jgi:RHS repeat-associated protein
LHAYSRSQALILVILSFAAMLCIGAPASSAQGDGITNATSTPVPGVAHDYIAGLNEIVNPANGALSVRIAQLVPLERGQNWPNYAFMYDSNLQYSLVPTWGTLPITGGGQIVEITNLTNQLAALPMFAPGRIFQASNTLNRMVQTGQNTFVNYSCQVTSGLTYTDLDGGRHSLGIEIATSLTQNTPNDCLNQFNATSFLEGGDEQVKAFASSSGAISLVDLHGNALNPTLEDTNGNYRNSTGRTTSVPALDTTQNETVNFSHSFAVTPNTQDACKLATSITGAGSFTTAKTVTLPNGEQYTFQYQANLGLLNKIIYPTGATVTYTWSVIPRADGLLYRTTPVPGAQGASCALQHDWFAITKRVVSFDGVNNAEEQDFVYTTSWPNADSYQWTSKTTTVTTMDLVRGTSFVTTYSYVPYLTPTESEEPYWDNVGYLPQENTIQYKDIGGALLKTTTKAWGGDLLLGECTTLPSGQISGKFYAYQPYNQFSPSATLNGAALATNLPTDVAEYDYGTLTTACVKPASNVLPIRETATTYQSFGNTPLFPSFASLLNRPATVQIYGIVSNTKTLLQETDYAYDGTTPTGVTLSASLHDEAHYGAGTSAPRGNPTTVTKKCFVGATNCTNSVTTSTYDTSGQVLTVTDANLNVTTYSYLDNYTTDDGTPPSATNAYVTKITRPTTGGVAHVTKFQYGFEDGKLRSKTDENNLVTAYCYWTGGCTGTAFDPFVRLTGTASPDGGTTTVAYNDAGPSPTVTTSKTINSTKTLINTAVSDGLGHVTQTQLKSDPQGTVYTDTKYDGLGNVYTVSNPYRSCTTDPTSSCGTTTYVYDALNRKTSATYPDSSVLTTAYCGASTLVTDPTKRWRRSTADSLGRLIEVDEPNSTTATVNPNGCPVAGDPIWKTNYTLDALGNLTNVLQNGSHARTFTYNSLSQLLTSTNPEVGTITYTYDANGNVKTKKDGRAITTTYGYDALNRELSRTYSNGDTSVTTVYDQSACLGLTACQNIGYRTSATDAGGSEAWSYQVDKPNLRSIHADQRTTKASPVNITMTVTSYFDLAGNLTQLHAPAASGRVVNYTYDAADRPSAAVDNTNGFKYATGWQTGSPTGCVATAVCYTPQGSIYGISFGPTSTFTGFNITNTYNNRLMPLEFKASSTAGNAIDITYNYVDSVKGGNAGHVFSVTNNLNASRTQSFNYDQVNRITSAGTNATTGAYCWGYQYSYDGAWGNLQSQAGWSPTYSTCMQGMLPGVTVDGNNHISMFAYDASGNATSDSTNTYTWDGESQLKSAAGVTYLHDGDGRRVSKSNGKLYWYGPGGEIITETDATGHELNDYIFFAGRHIGTQSSSGVGAFYVEDSLGSSRVLTTTAGVVCYDADFTPFGGERAYTNTCTQNNYKFEGKERDTETGNDYFGARYYTNRFGRWLSADWSSVPVAVPYAVLSNPQTLNLYSMVSDDPETSADLDGHCGDITQPCDPHLPKPYYPNTAGERGAHCICASAASAVHTLFRLGEVVVRDVTIAATVVSAVVTIAVAELTVLAPAAGDSDEFRVVRRLMKKKTDTRATKDEKNTLEGAQDQRESITKAQEKARREGRSHDIENTKKSEDREKHQHDDIVSGKAPRPDVPEEEHQ